MNLLRLGLFPSIDYKPEAILASTPAGPTKLAGFTLGSFVCCRAVLKFGT
jgi:hypothetical protein